MAAVGRRFRLAGLALGPSLRTRGVNALMTYICRDVTVTLHVLASCARPWVESSTDSLQMAALQCALLQDRLSACAINALPADF